MRQCKVCEANISVLHPNAIYCPTCSDFVKLRKHYVRRWERDRVTDNTRLCQAKKAHAKGNPDKRCSMHPLIGEKYCSWHKEKWERMDYDRERWANRDNELHELWTEVIEWAMKNQWPGTISQGFSMIQIRYQERHPNTGHPKAISRYYITDWYRRNKIPKGWPHAKGIGGAYQLIKWYLKECKGELNG